MTSDDINRGLRAVSADKAGCIVIRGDTDNIGGALTNRRLSGTRAGTERQGLITARITSPQIQVEGESASDCSKQAS